MYEKDSTSDNVSEIKREAYKLLQRERYATTPEIADVLDKSVDEVHEQLSGYSKVNVVDPNEDPVRWELEPTQRPGSH